MKLRLFVFGLTSAACLYGQMYGKDKKGFDFQEACFKNPALPYCPMRDFVNKPKKGDANSMSGPVPEMPYTIDAVGIDWRFADPAADLVAVLDCSRLSASALSHNLLDQMGSNQGLTQEEQQTVFRALSGVSQVAISVRDGAILIFVTGRAEGSVLPALEAGWKALPLSENTVLIGRAAAIDEASERLNSYEAPGELASIALRRAVSRGFWMTASAKLAGEQAVGAGVKRIELTASLQDGLTSDTAFEFGAGADPDAIGAWLKSLGNGKIDGNAVHVTISMDADQISRNVGQIASSPLGLRLGTVVSSARFIPVRDTATTVHTKPVIYGLSGGPKEAK